MSFKLGLSFKSFCLSKGKKKGCRKNDFLKKNSLNTWCWISSILARTFFHHPKKRMKRESLGSQIFYHPQEAQKKDWQEFSYHPQEEVMNHEKKSSRFFPLIHPQGKGYEYKYLALHSFLPNPQEVQVMNRKNTSNEFPLSSTRRGAASNNLAFLLPFALRALLLRLYYL
jgi:hypothetical protein